MAEERVLLTVEQVAKLTGLAKQTLDNWRSTKKRGGIPFVRLSDRAVRYDQAAVFRWLDQRTVDPSEEAKSATTRARAGARRRSA